MIPGKTYTPEEVLRLALRRKWWIIVPFVLGSVGAVAYGKQLPNLYRSETLLMLMPQRVPDSYVKNTDGSGLEARVNSLFQQILSTARLEKIILDFNLYPSERQALPMEDVVKRMRYTDIQIKIEGSTSFRVSHFGTNAETVRRVTERLASLFIEKDVRDREHQTEDTNDFLDSELEDAKRRLVEHEKKVEEFRLRYSHQLQSTPNVQTIQTSDAQLQLLADAENRDRERRLLLERQLADLESSPDIVTAPPSPVDNPAAALPVTAEQTVEQRLEAAEGQLRLLQTRLKPDHPDIRSMERAIRELRATAEIERLHDGAGVPTEQPRLTRVEALRQRRIRDVKAQIDDIDRQQRSKQEQQQHLRQIRDEKQANLDIVPTREAELAQLTRDYATLQNAYSSLLNKRQDWRLATNLERKSLGDQFTILEPASESKRPVGPNRPKIYAAGIAGSLMAGLFLVAVLEYLDSTFRSETDVQCALQLPTLASVPAIALRPGHRSRRRAG